MTKSKENFFKIEVSVNSITRFQIINHMQFTSVGTLLFFNVFKCLSFILLVCSRKSNLTFTELQAKQEINLLIILLT